MRGKATLRIWSLVSLVQFYYRLCSHFVVTFFSTFVFLCTLLLDKYFMKRSAKNNNNNNKDKNKTNKQTKWNKKQFLILHYPAILKHPCPYWWDKYSCSGYDGLESLLLKDSYSSCGFCEALLLDTLMNSCNMNQIHFEGEITTMRTHLSPLLLTKVFLIILLRLLPLIAT